MFETTTQFFYVSQIVFSDFFHKKPVISSNQLSKRHLQVQILSATVADTNLAPLKGDKLDLSPTNDAIARGKWATKKTLLPSIILVG